MKWKNNNEYLVLLSKKRNEQAYNNKLNNAADKNLFEEIKLLYKLNQSIYTNLYLKHTEPTLPS